jgi:hypothetical protein
MDRRPDVKVILNSRHKNELGGVAVMVALSMFLIMGMALSAMIIGRLVYKRRELQTAADAAVLAAAHTVQQHGMNFHPGIASTYLGRNSDLEITNYTINPHFDLSTKDYRRLVRLDLTARMRTWQKWLPQNVLTFKVSSWAQFNEQKFGEPWPMLYFILDASKSMEEKISGGYGKPAWDVLKEAFKAYATLTLPARNGVVVFAKAVESNAPPKTFSDRNVGPILSAINKVKSLNLQAGTNWGVAFDTVRKFYAKLVYRGKNVLLISDGSPTYGPGCKNDGTLTSDQCAVTVALSSGKSLRTKGEGANIITTELRTVRTGTDPQWAKMLVTISGASKSAGNDKSFNRTLVSKIGIQNFLNLVGRSICTWGPLKEPTDAFRAPMANPSINPRRLFVYLQDPVGGEVAIPMVTNVENSPGSHSFQYYKSGSDRYVIISRKSCTFLGANPKRRLIVRWDQPQLATPLFP